MDSKDSINLNIPMRRNIALAVSVFFLAGFTMPAMGQPGSETSAAPIVPFDAMHWRTKGTVAPDILNGQSCIKITNGELALIDAGFKNGSIDFDMAVDHARYFPGMGFRMLDSLNGELYYLRPHQSGNPDAMQYFPEFHGSDSWQIYFGPGFTNAKIIPYQQWIHVHIVVKDSAAEIFWDGEKTTALFISKLQRKPAAGYILLNNGGPNPAWFANFSYRKTDAVSIGSAATVDTALPDTRITHWDVSDPFDEALVLDKTSFPKAALPVLKWYPLDADERGIADLSRLSPHRPGSNTVFARLTIHAAQAGVRKLTFGFSDRVRIFFNGTLLYSGSDVFLSRDYRFLGTIGLFDAVYLRVHKGDNELMMAVSDDFGGWGLEADLN